MVEKREILEKSRQRIKKRRRIIWLSIAGALALFILIYSLISFTDIFIGSAQKSVESSPGQDEWTMFRRDLAHTGASGDVQAVPSGDIKWTFSAADVIHSSPAIVDGVIYFGSRDNHLYAVDAETGEQLWAFETGSWVESSPAVVDGVVYVGCNDSNLYAVDAKTGVQKWVFETVYALRSSPAVANGVVYIGADNYNVHAVDAATGKQIWQKKTDDIVISSPAVSKGIVTVGCADGLFYTFNAGNGKSRLEYATFAPINASPAIRDGVAYFVDIRGFMHAIDITEKNWLWENRLRQYWNALYIYGVAPKPSVPSGFLWSSMLAFGSNTASSIVLDGNFAYLGLGNNVLAVDLATHKIAWTFGAQDTVSATPLIAGDTVIACSQDGFVYAVDKATGQKLWDKEIGSPITSSPAMVDGVLYFGCHDGKLYAIE